MVLASAPIPALKSPRRPARSANSNGTARPALYIVVDRAQDMFFVVMQDAPSGRMHVNTEIKKIIYDAFEK